MINTTYSKILCLILLAVTIAGCGNQQNSDKQVTLTVSAAASLKDSVTEIEKEFEDQYPTINIIFNYGSTGSLRKQIEQGAPIDLFLSASKKDYELLVDRNIIDPSQGKAFLTNELVVIAHKDSEWNSLDDVIVSNNKMAIGTPNVVPAGTYAKEALDGMGVWGKLKSNFLYAKDVRHVLTLVENQSIPFGIVYESDLTSSNQIKVIEKIDSQFHTEIEYYAAILKNSKNLDEAQVFYQFLTNDERKAVFNKYGFTKK